VSRARRRCPEIRQVVEIYLDGFGWKRSVVLSADEGGFRVSPYRGCSLWVGLKWSVWRWPPGLDDGSPEIRLEK
jgi:hypothetical protein